MLDRIKRQIKNKKGFTLVEVVVATAIVAIVSVMLVYAFVGAAGINTRANDIKEAGRNFDNDIHTGAIDKADGKEEVTLSVTTNDGQTLTLLDGETFTMPMNVFTFVGGETGNRQMLIFRNPEDSKTP